MSPARGSLLDVDVPSGFQYRDDFITSDEEAVLTEEIGRLEFSTFEMRGVVARRRVAFFGRSYDAGGAGTAPLPAFLLPLRDKIAVWANVDANAFATALINEYRPGAPIGWHRQYPFEAHRASTMRVPDIAENCALIRSIALAVLLTACTGCRSEPDSHAGHQAGPATTPASSGSAAAVHVNTSGAPGPAPAGMVWVPGGTFWMGCENCGMPDALPVHVVAVNGFWMDKAPVTNAEFERFVKATGYATVAERPLDPKDYPGVPHDKLVPGSAVFTPTSSPVPLDNPLQWWRYTPGANWRHPEGPGTSLEERAGHPVVHVAFEDVATYAKWAGKRVPTEAEFEFAARGGLDRQKYPWGNEMTPGGKAAANTWQGTFPARDHGEDGYHGTSPVTAFPPNGFGLYDMGGNVWQWCSDWYRPDTYAPRAQGGAVTHDPQGPADSFDPQEPGAAKRVLRGGSYLCTDQYCARYLVGSRGKSEVTSGTSNLGFRLVQSVPQ